MKRVLILIAVLGTAHAEIRRCVVENLPTAVSSRKPAPCHSSSAAVAKSITSQVATRYHPERGGKPVVTFPCDGLGPKIYEITVETGSGHGGSLALWRAKRRGDGAFDVRGVLYHGSSLTRPADPVPHHQAAGVVALPALDLVRAAMTATIKEQVPPRKPNEGFGISGTSSSRNFHQVIRLVDDEGRVVERRYTGYAGSSDQDRYLGLEIAFAALSPVWKLAPDPQLAADDDDRRFFAAAFVAAVPHFDDDYAWWVMERYVDLARYLGTPPVIAGLLTRLVVPAKANRSHLDARTNALDALAKITGWDARTGKSVAEAARAYLDACK